MRARSVARERERETSRTIVSQLQNISGLVARILTIIIIGVEKVRHASNNSRAERKKRLFAAFNDLPLSRSRARALAHVAPGHRRCVIHERGINRKLKIPVTRGFRSLTVISTDTYRLTFPSCGNSRNLQLEEKVHPPPPTLVFCTVCIPSS